MGDYHPLDNSGYSERDPPCVAIHLPPEAAQSHSQRQTWERISVADRRADAGQ